MLKTPGFAKNVVRPWHWPPQLLLLLLAPLCPRQAHRNNRRLNLDTMHQHRPVPVTPWARVLAWRCCFHF